MAELPIFNIVFSLRERNKHFTIFLRRFCMKMRGVWKFSFPKMFDSNRDLFLISLFQLTLNKRCFSAKQQTKTVLNRISYYM